MRAWPGSATCIQREGTGLFFSLLLSMNIDFHPVTCLTTKLLSVRHLRRLRARHRSDVCAWRCATHHCIMPATQLNNLAFHYHSSGSKSTKSILLQAIVRRYIYGRLRIENEGKKYEGAIVRLPATSQGLLSSFVFQLLALVRASGACFYTCVPYIVTKHNRSEHAGRARGTQMLTRHTHAHRALRTPRSFKFSFFGCLQQVLLVCLCAQKSIILLHLIPPRRHRIFFRARITNRVEIKLIKATTQKLTVHLTYQKNLVTSKHKI